ncbi:MAG: serine protease [Actinomycetes bacterium]
MSRKRIASRLVATMLILTGPLVCTPAVAQPVTPSLRVIGGTPVDQGRTPTPWFVQLTPVIGGADSLCGGTAISDRWILTAAHCVTFDGRVASLQASRARVNPASLDSGPALRWSSITVHPKYDPAFESYDAALIHTSSPMNTPGLPYTSSSTTPIVGTELQVFGFGGTGASELSHELRVGAISDLAGPTGRCGRYGSLYRSATMLCAGLANSSADSCQGDSGGPLTTTGPTRTLVGIVSWGNGCAVARYPGIYARVSALASWVQAISGVQPRIGPAAAAKVHVTRACPQAVCTLNRGDRLDFSVRNNGNAPGTWRATGVGATFSPRSGSLAAAASRNVTIRTSSTRRACVTATVRGSGRTVTTFKIRINGGLCR